MNHSDPVADMLTRIRNALMVKKRFVSIPYSKFKEEILKVLVRSGFLISYSVETINDFSKEIIVKLKYVNGESSILGIKRQSRSSCPKYVGFTERIGGCPQHSLSIISTSKGVMSQRDAFSAKVGGEVVCTVW